MVWSSHCRPLYRGVAATPVLENDERNGVACILKIRVESNDDFSSSLTNGFPELVFNLYLIGNSRRPRQKDFFNLLHPADLEMDLQLRLFYLVSNDLWPSIIAGLIGASSTSACMFYSLG
ncbi:hypothetical protein R3P38DRAFT_2805907 [Favolaschia claudopus]|uniref:Uncharacterized protein n=1 Tax=Favolaschia claudopus TaxID=2862362 RepID=A0AAV9ZLU0_9AGAR